MEKEMSTAAPVTDQTNRLHQVTPLSKYLAMILFIAMPFIGGWIGYAYGHGDIQERRMFTDRLDKMPGEVRELNEHHATGGDYGEITVEDLSAEYLSSNYRVVGTIRNPFYYKESKYDTLVIASPRGINDFSCGGIYGPSTCYLFLESSYAETETPVFVGTWKGDLYTLRPDTVRFISPMKITFEAGFDDAGIQSSIIWEYDLTDASSTKIGSLQ